MKKLILVLGGILLVTIGVRCSTKPTPKIFVPEEYQKKYDMEQRYQIYNAWAKVDQLPPTEIDALLPDSIKYIPYVSPNLDIRDVFTREIIDNVYDKSNPADKNKFALYTINYLTGNRLLLIYNKGEFTVINTDDYPVVIDRIIRYFKKHKDLDERLLPLCIQEVTRIYVDNHRTNTPGGPWRKWWGERADSLGKIYNQKLRY